MPANSIWVRQYIQCDSSQYYTVYAYDKKGHSLPFSVDKKNLVPGYDMGALHF